jgi:hypothetical protein
MLDTLLFVEQLDKLGVAFVSIHDGFDTTTPQGKLQMHILSAFSEYFRKQLASKVLGGMVERAKEGKHMGRRPLGYQIGKSGFEIHEEESKIVRIIFSMYLDQNLGLRGIADHLNSMGLKSLRGNVWSHVSIREILENEVYTGTFVWGDIRVENNHPPIIDRVTWEKVQSRRKRKKELGGRAQNNIFLLSGLVHCGICNNATMVGRTARKLGIYTYRYYVCNNYASKGKGVCTGGYYRADKIEKIVIDDIKDFVKSEKTEIKKETVPADLSIIKEKIELRRKELATMEAMLLRAAEAYERGMYDLEWYSMRKEKIEAERAAATSEIIKLEKQAAGKLSAEDITRRIKNMSRAAKSFLKEKDPIKAKSKLQQFINNIVIKSEDEIIVQYRL